MGETTSSLKINLINLKIALKTISELNKPVLFHAEDYSCLNRHKIKENNLFDHMNSRPSICEKKAIENVIEVSKQSNHKIHFCHISSYDGLDLLKKRTKNISCGVTPHHLLFNVEKIIENQTYFKVNPPIRRRYDREVLFKGIQSGLIDIIESDHAPHTLEEKNLDFDQAPSGVPGVETMYPLLLYLVKKEKLSFHRLINLICEKPADLMNISKGKLELGNDADFIVLDIKKTSLIKSENLHSQIEWSPFENWKAIFPKYVFIRGEKIIENDELLVNNGFGRFVGE
jgi:dihydroorotase